MFIIRGVEHVAIPDEGVRHVLLLLCQFVNHIEVTRLPIYVPSEAEKEDPKLYANNLRKLMATEGNLTLSDIGLPEKRVYHAALNELKFFFGVLQRMEIQMLSQQVWLLREDVMDDANTVF
ncbi:hypothetical protein ACLOJK_002868 [Asimina triloba]